MAFVGAAGRPVLPLSSGLGVDRSHAHDGGPGGPAFDIGAHLGDRTESFLRLGARVVAAEPRPRMVRTLRLLFHRADRVAPELAVAGRMAVRGTACEFGGPDGVDARLGANQHDDSFLSGVSGYSADG